MISPSVCQQEIIDPVQITPLTAGYLSQFFRKSPKSFCMVMNYFLQRSFRNLTLFMRQDTIAKKLGFSREHINRVIGELAELGIISKKYRHMTSCIYTLPAIFNDPQTRQYLHGIFQAVRWIAVQPLSYAQLKALESRESKNVTLYKEGINKKDSISIFIYNPLPSVPFKPYRVTYTRERESMFEANPDIPAYLNSLESIDLTLAGKIRLSGFPEEAVKHGDGKLKTFKSARDPFAFLFNAAKEYCTLNKKWIKWEMVDGLSATHGISRDMAMYIPRPIQPSTSRRQSGDNSNQKEGGWKGHGNEHLHPKQREANERAGQVAKDNSFVLDQNDRQAKGLRAFPTRDPDAIITADWLEEQIDAGYYTLHRVENFFAPISSTSDEEREKIAQMLRRKKEEPGKKQAPKTQPPSSFQSIGSLIAKNTDSLNRKGLNLPPEERFPDYNSPAQCEDESSNWEWI